MRYTVIGFWKDNLQPFIVFVEAPTPMKAVKITPAKIDAEHEDLGIVEVIKGYHKGVLENEKIIERKDEVCPKQSRSKNSPSSKY